MGNSTSNLCNLCYDKNKYNENINEKNIYNINFLSDKNKVINKNVTGGGLYNINVGAYGNFLNNEEINGQNGKRVVNANLLSSINNIDNKVKEIKPYNNMDYMNGIGDYNINNNNNNNNNNLTMDIQEKKEENEEEEDNEESENH